MVAGPGAAHCSIRGVQLLWRGKQGAVQQSRIKALVYPPTEQALQWQFLPGLVSGIQLGWRQALDPHPASSRSSARFSMRG